MTLLPSGLTVAQVTQGLIELADFGLAALGQEELIPLLPILVKLGEDAVAVAEGPSAQQVLQSEIDAEQAAGRAAEAAKFPKGG